MANKIGAGVAVCIFAFIAYVLWDSNSRSMAHLRMTSEFSNLKQIKIALYNYAAEHKGHLPPLATSQEAEAALVPAYLQDRYALTSPLDHKLYVFNARLSRKSVGALSAHDIPLVYGATSTSQPVKGGGWEQGRLVLSTNGKTHWVSDTQWGNREFLPYK